jgi:hypothetical protein
VSILKIKIINKQTPRVADHGGRASEGASRLKHSRDNWELLHVGAATHLAGHLAKFYIERGNYKVP